ncbi:MAG: hypothetical protein HY617_00905 [Candidatus Sungbacteria bacterium]|nr:hypothetical protein [Candidatus Sungbacteria bacterium]
MATHSTRSFFVLVAVLSLLVGSRVLANESRMNRDGTVSITGATTGKSAQQTGGGGGGSTCQAVPAGQIALDGCPDDWYRAGIKPLIVDNFGDVQPIGADLLNVYMTNNDIYAYFLLEFAGPFEGASFLLLNVDGDRRSGCATPTMGFEYGVTFSRDGSYVGDARDCGWGGDDFPTALQVVFNGRFIEATIPLEVLKTLAPKTGLKTIEVFCNNDECEPGIYTLKTASQSTHVGGSMKGLTPLGALCQNLRTNQQVWIWMIGGSATHYDCQKAGLIVMPGDAVVVAGTGVVPKLRHPSN